MVVISLKNGWRIRERFPQRIPVIVYPRNNTIKQIDKQKYLVPEDITFGQFVYIVRKRLKLADTEALFLFTEKNTIPPSSELFSVIDHKYRSSAGYVVVYYSFESVFG